MSEPSEQFDPYYEWLGIPPRDQPANHYRLLGIEMFEANLNVIERAADRQMGHVRTFQNGQRAAESQSLLNELSAAKVNLLQPDKKAAYDQALRSQFIDSLIPAPGQDDAPGVAPVRVFPVGYAGPSEPTNEPLPEPSTEPPPPNRVVRSRRRTQQNRALTRLFAFLATLVLVIVIGGVGALALGILRMPESQPDSPAAPRKVTQIPAKQRPKKRTRVEPEVQEPVVEIADPPPVREPRTPPSVGRIAEVLDQREKTLPTLNESRTAPTDPPLSTAALSGSLSAPLAAKIKAATGVVGKDFALCQTMPPSVFVELVEPLRRVGYRPIRVRPYDEDTEIKVAAVWVRDGAPWRIVAGVDARVIDEADRRLRSQGFRPVDVAGWKEKSERYLAIWTRDGQLSASARLDVGVPENTFRSLSARARRDGFAPQTHQFFFGNDGQKRYSKIWQKSASGRSWAQWESGRDDHERSMSRPATPLDVCLDVQPDGLTVYGGLQAGLPNPDIVGLHGFDAVSHLEKCNELISGGYRPKAIAVVPVGAQRLLMTASIWDRSKPAPMIAVRPANTPPTSPKPTSTTPSTSLPRPTVPFNSNASAPIGFAPAPVKRLPVPSKEQRQQASAKVRDVFRKEFESTSDDAAKTRLANKLLETANDTEEPASRFGLLDEARKLALSAIDTHLALRLTDELIKQFEVKPWQLKADTMTRLTEAVNSPIDRRTLSDLAMQMAKDAAADKEFAQARKIVDLISKLNKPRDRDLAVAALALAKSIDGSLKQWEAADRARLKLIDAPDDPQANRLYGAYLCFTLGEWEQGLKHLAAGSDELLAELAKTDLTNPGSGSDRLALADRWFDAAEDRSGSQRNGALLRAKHWYTQALPQLQDLDRTKANLRLEQIGSEVTAAPGAASRLAWLDAPVGEVKTLQGHTSSVTAVAVLHSGTQLFSGSQDESIRVWDLASGEETGRVASSVGDITALGLSPDDAFIVVAGEKPSIEVRNRRTGKLFNIVDVVATPRGMVLARDANLMAVSRSASTKNIAVFTIRGTRGAHLTCPQYPSALAISGSGKYVVAGSLDRNVYLWNPKSVQIAAKFEGLSREPMAIAISPNDELVAACTYNQATIWNTETRQVLKQIPFSRSCRAIAFTVDSKRLLTGHEAGHIAVWDAQTGASVQSLQSTSTVGRLSASCTAVLPLPDARGAVTAGSDGVIRVWRLPD